ncbi:MAG: U32 family peptidase [Vallitalea sp.]|jgi:putative protease|nr:U32 family peptidase [Vallitalea sp.]
MSKYFNNKEIELLAPAGTFDIFNSIIHANCDAVYFGGQILNMRMIRKGYNFSNDEIKEAINIAHSLNKKVYITVNNLFNNDDINMAKEYLLFLNEVKPDAMIIQDTAILELVNNLSLDINLHSSVMMNVHNIPMINHLEKLGISRVVLSREMSLDQIKYIKTQTNMEIEYFTHGDMCVAHGSQCHYSGFLFGMSSNRGRCLKPCRWDYKIKKDGKLYNTQFPMAVKDLCMYNYLPEMIEAGIDSFKIEGRMRDKEFIVNLINYYGDALDRYIKDPIGYNRNKDYKKIYDTRKRDLSTGYAFGKPGLSNINTRYEGTGKFYSTGKMFSTPTEEKEINQNKLNEIIDYINNNITPSTITTNKKELSVKVNNIEQANIAISKGVNNIYLSGDVYTPNKPFTTEDIKNIASNKKNSKIIVGLPKMMSQLDFINYTHFLDKNAHLLDGLLVTNIGAISAFEKYDIDLIGDYTLNIYNYMSTNFYKRIGLDKFTTSIETPISDLIHTISKSSIKSELLVQGSICVMYLEHDLYDNIEANDEVALSDNQFIDNSIMTLVTPNSEYPVHKDIHGKCHVLSSKELCLYNLIPTLNKLPINSYRIEAQNYTNDQLSYLIDTYKEVINTNEINTNIKRFSKGHTLGALNYISQV